MKIGIIALGRMGGGIARRMMPAENHRVVFDEDAASRDGHEPKEPPVKV